LENKELREGRREEEERERAHASEHVWEENKKQKIVIASPARRGKALARETA